MLSAAALKATKNNLAIALVQVCQPTFKSLLTAPLRDLQTAWKLSVNGAELAECCTTPLKAPLHKKMSRVSLNDIKLLQGMNALFLP